MRQRFPEEMEIHIFRPVIYGVKIKSEFSVFHISILLKKTKNITVYKRQVECSQTVGKSIIYKRKSSGPTMRYPNVTDRTT